MSDSNRSPRSPRFMRRISLLNLALLALVCVLAAALVATVTKPVTIATQIETVSVLDHDKIWTTLGTMSGPIPSPDRSQPANLLWNNDMAILIDAGDGAAAYQSLSLRFDMADRSIVYTGDTGPSDAVEKLAQGANLLISEIVDPDSELASLKAKRTDIPFFADPVLKLVTTFEEYGFNRFSTLPHEMLTL